MTYYHIPTPGMDYGRMAIVAINFYVKTGNPAELDAACWYARYAARAAQLET